MFFKQLARIPGRRPTISDCRVVTGSAPVLPYPLQIFSTYTAV